jgi:hypothetical protein
MQNNIDIFPQERSGLRGNMLKAKCFPTTGQIDNQRPAGVAVTIAAHNDQGRTDRTQLVHNPFRANVAQMPDLVRSTRKIDDPRRQFIMGISDNEDLHGGSAFPKTMLISVRLRRLNNIALGTTRSTFKELQASSIQKLKPISYWDLGDSLEVNLCVSDSRA